LDVEDIARMFGRGAEFPMVLLRNSCSLSGYAMRCRSLPNMASGFVVLGNGYRLESMLGGGDVNVAAHEIHEISALQQELRHPGIIVSFGGDVAIAALFGFFGTYRVRHKSGKRLSGEAWR